MRRALAIAALAAAACGAKRGPCLLATARVGPAQRLIQVCAKDEQAHEVKLDVAGDVRSAIVTEGGAAILIGVAAPGRGSVDQQLWRVDASSGDATQLWHGVLGMLAGASDDGKTMLLDDGKLVALDGEPRLIDLKPPHAEIWRASAISEDGQRVAISIGAGCPPHAHDVDCRLEVWGYDRGAPDRGWRVIASGATSEYQPRFVPGSGGRELLYHAPTPSTDPKCVGPWSCRTEDTWRIGFDGGAPTLVRAHAWTPRYSPDGEWLALADKDAHELWLGPTRGGAPAVIAKDAYFAGPVSRGGDWVAYEGLASALAIASRDGGGGRAIGEGHPIGWIDGPLPEGAAIAARPSAAQQAKQDADAVLQRAQAHRRGGETIVRFELPASVASAARPVALQTLIELLGGPDRVLAIMPRTALCELPRGSTPWFVVDDDGRSYAVVSNRLGDGERDVNPLRAQLGDAMPHPARELHARFGDAIELIGVDLPRGGRGGDTITMTFYYHVLEPPPTSWRVFVHVDGPSTRINGDHAPTICSPTQWRAGEYVTDRFDVTAGTVSTPAGDYHVFMGFFTGGGRQPVTSTPHPDDDRVDVGTMELR